MSMNSENGSSSQAASEVKPQKIFEIITKRRKLASVPKRYREVKHFLDFLPEGFRYIGSPELFKADILVKRALRDANKPVSIESNRPLKCSLLRPNEVKFGFFAVHHDVKPSDLKKLKDVVPKREFKMMRNRFNARAARKTVAEKLDDLTRENTELKQELAKAKQ